jgi:hypothetical protein
MNRLTSIVPLVALLGSMTLLDLSVAVGPLRAAAQGSPQTWSETKCVRYKKAWSDALARRGTEGLGRAFLDAHEAFLAAGCTARGDVCPRTAQELDLANIMVVQAMNAGTASTFPPFACRK